MLIRNLKHQHLNFMFHYSVLSESLWRKHQAHKHSVSQAIEHIIIFSVTDQVIENLNLESDMMNQLEN